jgi:hypothetical protein
VRWFEKAQKAQKAKKPKAAAENFGFFHPWLQYKSNSKLASFFFWLPGSEHQRSRQEIQEADKRQETMIIIIIVISS